jgi:acetate kinase
MALAVGMKILVLNAGSSSLKFNLFDAEQNSERVLTKGLIERVTNMGSAVGSMFEQLGNTQVEAVGHRVVHGGDRFFQATLIDDEVEKGIEKVSELAPLHNPHNLEAFRAAREHIPGAKHVAVFDTAFHHTLPPLAYLYGLPWQYFAENKVRRYGFHGISHRYISRRFAELQRGSNAGCRIITCHLGNGCSVCAIRDGKSVDTSMGFTPLEGLMMGTRSGDLDPGALLHLLAHGGDAAQLSTVLNNESGLKGLSGISNDMRDLLKAGDEGNERARVAVDAFCYRVAKYIGAYLAVMNGADALIFAGGIGENAPPVRERICAGLSNLGIGIDPELNRRKSDEARQIGSSPIPVWVIPTNEELMIAQDTLRCVQGLPHQ